MTTQADDITKYIHNHVNELATELRLEMKLPETWEFSVSAPEYHVTTIQAPTEWSRRSRTDCLETVTEIDDIYPAVLNVWFRPKAEYIDKTTVKVSSEDPSPVARSYDVWPHFEGTVIVRRENEREKLINYLLPSILQIGADSGKECSDRDGEEKASLYFKSIMPSLRGYPPTGDAWEKLAEEMQTVVVAARSREGDTIIDSQGGAVASPGENQLELGLGG